MIRTISRQADLLALMRESPLTRIICAVAGDDKPQAHAVYDWLEGAPRPQRLLAWIADDSEAAAFLEAAEQNADAGAAYPICYGPYYSSWVLPEYLESY